jgi:hypothetical protein
MPTSTRRSSSTGAERAHRLTYTDLPAQQEGAPESSATMILAEDGNGLVGSFAFSAAADQYDSSFEDLLLETSRLRPGQRAAGADDAAAAPEGEMSPEDMEELEEMFEDEG